MMRKGFPNNLPPRNKQHDMGSSIYIVLVAVLIVLVLGAVVVGYLQMNAGKKAEDEARKQAASDEARFSQSTPKQRRTTTAPTKNVQNKSEPPETGQSQDLDEMETRRTESRKNTLETILDPNQDGWTTEAANNAAGDQLKTIVKMIEHPEENLDIQHAESILATNFNTGRLRPSDLSSNFQDKAVTVWRSLSGDVNNTAEVYKNADGLLEAVTELTKALEGTTERHGKFKIIRVNLGENTFTTSAYFQVYGRTEIGSTQIKATWQCDWEWQADTDDPPRLTSIRVEDYEEVAAIANSGKWFADCTESILGHNPSFNDQLIYGMNDWVRRIERLHFMDVFLRYGVAVGDVNNDGLDDLFVCAPAGLPNKLFIQNADGTADDVSQAAGVDWLDHTSSALFVDLDNDGDQDLVMATKVGILILANNGNTVFAPRAHLQVPALDVQGLSAIDYDSDGDLDLYLLSDFSNSFGAEGSAESFIYHDANDGGANALYRNDIATVDGKVKWQFNNVTNEVGLDQDNTRHSLAASWEDFDNDGDPDLYVANDYGRNCLYRNDGGKFTNIAENAGVVDYGSGMSVSWGDYNRDGYMDLYVGNMFSSAGNRVTTQNDFMPGVNEKTRKVYSRFAKGNSLFLNAGDGTFVETGKEATVEIARWAWSSLFADINNDGWEDMVVANGYITTDDTEDL